MRLSEAGWHPSSRELALFSRALGEAGSVVAGGRGSESHSRGRRWSVASVATGNGKCSQHGGGPVQRAEHLTRQEGA